MAKEGAIVGLLDIKSPDAVLRDVLALGAEGLSIGVDVADSKALDAAVKAVAEKFGRLDGAANFAGFVAEHPLDSITDKDWDDMIAVNLTGVKNSVVSELRYMKGPGSIVNAAILAGRIGTARHITYGAAKHGVIGISKAAAQEVGHRGIRVNAVAP